MSEPTTQYLVASKACKNPEAAFKIVNYLIKNEQKWIDEGVSTTEMTASDFYPLYNTYDNADEIEVSYDVLTKYLAGEITMDDVDFSTHKLLKSDMEAVTKLKKSLTMTSVWTNGIWTVTLPRTTFRDLCPFWSEMLLL